MPQSGGGDDCGGLGLVIMIIVAVVVTVLTEGATSEFLIAALGETGGTIAAAAVGAAAGSVASQAVGMAIGVVDEFSWKAVALAALTAGVTKGLPAGNLLGTTAGTIGNSIVRAAVANAMTQGIAVAVGLQDHFDWRGVAASAIGAGVGQAVGTSLSGTDINPYVATGLRTFAAGAATAMARGGKVAIAQIAADAFGNTLGSSLGEQILQGGQQESRLGQAEATSGDFARMDGAGYRSQAPGYIAGVDGTVGGYSSLSSGAAGQSQWDDEPLRPMAGMRTMEFRVGRDEAVVKTAEFQYGRDEMVMQEVADKSRAGGPGRTSPMPELDIQGNPTGGTMQIPVPDNVLMPGENVKGNVFFGGAGMDGLYVKDMVRAFDKQGIALTPANRDVYSNGTGLDATAGVQITRFGQLPVVPLLDNVPQTGDSQFNLLGYSYGSNMAAQVAITYARGGTTVDNVVLIGSPISEGYLKTLQSEPNIKNVVVINLTDKGDPISAGMTDASLIGSALTLKDQMPKGEGHFYYAPATPAGQVRRDALAQYLYQRGLR